MIAAARAWPLTASSPMAASVSANESAAKRATACSKLCALAVATAASAAAKASQQNAHATMRLNTSIIGRSRQGWRRHPARAAAASDRSADHDQVEPPHFFETLL